MDLSSPQDFKGTERFALRRRLGSGSFGVVYEAYDREKNCVVALKTLRQVEASALRRFKQEFRFLADVTHPNLATLYELLSDGDQWFLTMELVDGVDFLRYVREDLDPEPFDSWPLPSIGPLVTSGSGEPAAPAPPPPLPNRVPLNLTRLRSALAQLAAAVCALHDTGKLHRDIKPSNVLVTREGRVVLLDFGLVGELTPEGITQSVDVVGTPAYMSPEQAARVPLSEASDWYSVGAMLYEALTGRLTFLGSILDVLMQKQTCDPLAPRELEPRLPEDLDGLCRDLLRRDPRARPPGPEVLRRLGSTPARPLVSSARKVSSPYPAVFVGRERQLAALRDAFRAMKEGRTVAVSVHGGSGMGKSALVHHFLDNLRRQEKDAVVLRGRCYERESVPYKALDSLVDALSRYLKGLPSAEVEAVLPRDILALARLFPVLRQVESVAGAQRRVLQIPDSRELRRRAFGALRELLIRLADRRSLVLFVDDLHWGDADSAALLTEILRPPDPPVLLLIGCYRSEEAETSPLLRTILPLRVSADAALEVREIVAEQLTPSESRELALALLGSSAAKESAEVIAQDSGGNPFFIDELVRHLQAGGGLRPEGRGLGADGGGAATTLDQMIRTRVVRLSEEARRLLEMVAVAGQPIDLEVACRAAKLEMDEEGPLAVLRAGHLARTRSARARNEIEPYHDRIRDTVMAQLSPEALCECHLRLAVTLQDSGRADPEMLAVHYQGAGDRESAAEYAGAAAAQAAEALAFDRAARLYRLALDLRATEDSERRGLTIKLGDALANAGRGAEAAQVYLSALSGAGSAEAIDLHRRAAQQLLISGHIDEGLRVLNTVLRDLGMRLPETPRVALLSLLARRAQIRLRGLRFRERDETRVAARELLRIDTCWSVAIGFGMVDMVRGADFQARHLLLALRAGEPYRVARALALEVAYVAAPGGARSRRRTERLTRVADALAQRVNHPHALGLSAVTSGIAAWCQGRWKDARELCERAEGILRERCAGVSWEIDNAQMWGLAALFFLGEVKELSRRLPLLLKEAYERGDLLASTNLRVGFFSHIAWLAADDPERAREELREGLEGWSHQRFDFPHIWAHGAQRDIALYSGEGLVVSERIVERWRAIARSLDRFAQATLITGLSSRARRRLAGAVLSADHEQREALLRGAEAHAASIEGEKTHWGDALALLVRAGVAASRGDAERARALLSAAETGFTTADMALHAAAARRRRGELLGGDTGSALVEAADAWMAAQSIKNPERMTAMLAPGKWVGDP